ncbi:MAG TPA: AIM24 family protein [Acidobacteriota bacterium]|nr:AIM24 family protein [Acidobacteriota bacterium]
MSQTLFILENNQQVGPLSAQDIGAMVQAGRVNGETFCWGDGMPNWQPLRTVLPQLFPAAPAPAAPVQAAPAAAFQGATQFEVLKTEYYKMPKITIQQAEVVLEAGALHYMVGNIEIEVQTPSAGGFIKSKLTGERSVKPVYRGSGTIFLEPTFGEVNILELRGETWILDRGAFLACDRSITVDMYTNKAISGLFGGEGFFQTSVAGHGKVMYNAPGPVETLQLNNEVLTVDGSFAVARTGNLDFRVEKATKKLFSSWASGEGFVNVFRGTGTVLIAPVPNRFVTLINEFGGLHTAISRISK